jgi:hypothetical protein
MAEMTATTMIAAARRPFPASANDDDGDGGRKADEGGPTSSGGGGGRRAAPAVPPPGRKRGGGGSPAADGSPGGGGGDRGGDGDDRKRRRRRRRSAPLPRPLPPGAAASPGAVVAAPPTEGEGRGRIYYYSLAASSCAARGGNGGRRRNLRSSSRSNEGVEDVEMPRAGGAAGGDDHDRARGDRQDGRIDDGDVVIALLLGEDDLDAGGGWRGRDEGGEDAGGDSRRSGTPFDDIRDDLLGTVGHEDLAEEDVRGEVEEEEEEEEEEERLSVCSDDRFGLSLGDDETDDLLDAPCKIDGGEGGGPGAPGYDDGPVLGGGNARFYDGACRGRVENAAPDNDDVFEGDDDDGDDDDDTSSDSLLYSLSRSSHAPDLRDDDSRDDDGGGPAVRVMRVENAIDSPATAEAPRAANAPVGAMGLLPLWDRIAGKLARANCRYERTFYGHVKHYLSRQTKRVLPSDVERIEEFLDDFKTTMKKLDEVGNDYDDICNYGGWIECIIDNSREYLSPAPADLAAPHPANPTAGANALRPLWNQIIGKMADAECQYERLFYGHLKWYMSRRSKQSRGRVPLYDLDRINACLEEFETTLRRLNDKGNDCDDIHFYGSLIEDIINNGKEKLSLVD